MKLISNPEPPHHCPLPRTPNAARALFGVELQVGAVIKCDECGCKWKISGFTPDRGVLEIDWQVVEPPAPPPPSIDREMVYYNR
jgi:hypothetical protein